MYMHITLITSISYINLLNPTRETVYSFLTLLFTVGFDATGGSSCSLRGLHLHRGEHPRKVGEGRHVNGGGQTGDPPH